MSGDERGGETFLAEVYPGFRVTIHKPVRDSLGVEIGDIARINLEIVSRARDRKDDAKG